MTDTRRPVIGHYVGWDVWNCPDCGPVHPDDVDDHDHPAVTDATTKRHRRGTRL